MKECNIETDNVKYTDNVIDKFFKNVSSYWDLASISDMLKDDVGDYLNRRKNIEGLNLAIKQTKISSIIKSIMYFTGYSIGNEKINKIRDFLSSHEEILNSFFNEDGQIKNEGILILKKMVRLVKIHYNLDNIFKDIKTFEDLQSKLYEEEKEEEKENKIAFLMSFEFPLFFNHEEIDKEDFKSSFKKIRDFLSSHEEILNSFFYMSGGQQHIDRSVLE